MNRPSVSDSQEVDISENSDNFQTPFNKIVLEGGKAYCADAVPQRGSEVG